MDCFLLLNRLALTALSEVSKLLAERILGCVSLGLRQDQNFLAKAHRGMLSQGMKGEVERWNNQIQTNEQILANLIS